MQNVWSALYSQTHYHRMPKMRRHEEKTHTSQQIGEALGPDPQSIINILQFIKEIQLYDLI